MTVLDGLIPPANHIPQLRAGVGTHNGIQRMGVCLNDALLVIMVVRTTRVHMMRQGTAYYEDEVRENQPHGLDSLDE